MEEFLLLTILFVLVFYFGWKMHEWFMFEALRDKPEIFEEAIKAAREYRVKSSDSDIEHKLIEMEIETHNGVVYAFDKSNGRFLGQGDTVTQAAIAASMRFKGVAFTHPDITMDDEEDQKA